MATQFYAIKNCEFAFKCPRAWERLDLTGKDDERHCPSCEKRVYLCVADVSLARHAGDGHCVAVEDITNVGSMLVGQVASEYSSPMPPPSEPEQPAVTEKNLLYFGLKIAPPIYGTRVNLDDTKINWD